MAQITYQPPNSPEMFDEQGNMLRPWRTFLEGVGFTQSAAIADLAASPTNAQIATTVNAILAALRAQGRIAK